MKKSILDTTVSMGPEGAPAQPTLREMMIGYYVAKTGDESIGHAAAAEYARRFEAQMSEQDPLTLILKKLNAGSTGEPKMDIEMLLRMLGGGKSGGLDLQGFLNGTKSFVEAFSSTGSKAR